MNPLQDPVPPVRRSPATIRGCVSSSGRASPATAPWRPTAAHFATTVSRTFCSVRVRVRAFACVWARLPGARSQQGVFSSFFFPSPLSSVFLDADLDFDRYGGEGEMNLFSGWAAESSHHAARAKRRFTLRVAAIWSLAGWLWQRATFGC